LMFYPKEWRSWTDLRSNDILDFFEKIATLQDKTYEEIVRTQKKVGTTEKTISVEEQIKLNFLEKLYNFIVSALQKVIPLSKKFFDLIATSKLVDKKVIEDVFGVEEETVTRTIKLPEKVRQNKEEFLAAMDGLKSAINTLMDVDTTMFSSDNITRFFAEGGSYRQTTGRVGEPEVKEGVDFVFEQNPELANTVYSALGFEVNI